VCVSKVLSDISRAGEGGEGGTGGKGSDLIEEKEQFLSFRDTSFRRHSDKLHSTTRITVHNKNFGHPRG
jgi:hypothetical protein